MSSLYDKLESHIRALETLGVTTDKCAAMLYPLVESALPEEILRAWQRSVVLGNDVESKERLTSLLNFLTNEVENEERIAMAVQGFGISSESDNAKKIDPEKAKKSKPKSETKDIPTATTLLTTKDDKSMCVFCSGVHKSPDCIEARKMTHQEKQSKLKQQNGCFNCTRNGHTARKCRVNLSCNKRHVVVMCPEMSEKGKTIDEKTKYETKIDTDSNLANFENVPEVLLQTLRVRLRGEKAEREVRAIIDTGSQRSYVTREAATAVGCTPVGCLRLTHNLFGGVKSQEQEHNRYQFRMIDLGGKFPCRFEVLENEEICSNIPNVRVGLWAAELKRLKIELSDVHDVSEPIQVLIRADVAGKLMTGKTHVLKSGPVAVETRLRWTLMGKGTESRERSDAALTVISIFQAEVEVEKLWELGVLGISDPLPWISDHPPIPSNRAMAEKRLEATTKRLRSGGYLDAYDGVLDEWLKEGIIERVPDTEIENFGHYLPHRHVIKQDSTTKIRPVFDASAREK
ncbi:uncharacterized protein LOC124404699 [Diprion similis]|uniref:uncharacterized protein LOC124404699 n=1 Tax=Diprion similis TaxID=362088 RepID=UPI001EF77E98|nr:uncharacterized protein LOC124404699 [Diprion similis]